MPSWWTWTWLWLLLLPTALVKALCASSQAAVAKLQAHQQAAKARRANVEKGLLKEGIELEEKKFKVTSATGFGSSRSSLEQIAQQRAQLLRNEAIILSDLLPIHPS